MSVIAVLSRARVMERDMFLNNMLVDVVIV